MIIKKHLTFMMDFADWLKTYRKKSGLTLRKLSDRANNICSDAYLSQIENRRYKGKKGNYMQPDIEIVEALAKALNRPVDEARLAAGYAPTNAETYPDFITNVDWKEVPEVQLNRIARFIEFELSSTHRKIDTDYDESNVRFVEKPTSKRKKTG